MSYSDLLESYCRHTQRWLVHLSCEGSDWMPNKGADDVLTEIALASKLSPDEAWALYLECALTLVFTNEEEAWRCFGNVVGDEGPTETNPYSGPMRIYAALYGPAGCMTENT